MIAGSTPIGVIIYCFCKLFKALNVNVVHNYQLAYSKENSIIFSAGSAVHFEVTSNHPLSQAHRSFKFLLSSEKSLHKEYTMIIHAGSVGGGVTQI